MRPHAFEELCPWAGCRRARVRLLDNRLLGNLSSYRSRVCPHPGNKEARHENVNWRGRHFRFLVWGVDRLHILHLDMHVSIGTLMEVHVSVYVVRGVK